MVGRSSNRRRTVTRSSRRATPRASLEQSGFRCTRVAKARHARSFDHRHVRVRCCRLTADGLARHPARS
jgi:hypothetical protein